MAHILNKFGYKQFNFIRMGYVLGGKSAKQNRFLDHVVLQVKNKNTGKYELHDPDYNVHYAKYGDIKLTPLSVEEIYLTKNIEHDIILVRGQDAGKDLPVEETINFNVCKMNCKTMKEVFYDQQFFVAAENQTTGELYFNFSQLGHDKKRIFDFMIWFISSSNQRNEILKVYIRK